jgi:hypothetical protein
MTESPLMSSLTREEMIRRGAYGFLDRAYECDIPLRDVILVAPPPACEMWGEYTHAGDEQPVEVKYSQEDNAYLVFAGSQRVKKAIARGDRYLPAFVEADRGEIGVGAIPRRPNKDRT